GEVGHRGHESGLLKLTQSGDQRTLFIPICAFGDRKGKGVQPDRTKCVQGIRPTLSLRHIPPTETGHDLFESWRFRNFNSPHRNSFLRTRPTRVILKPVNQFSLLVVLPSAGLEKEFPRMLLIPHWMTG